MASIGATKIVLLLFAIVFPFLLFQYQGNTITASAQNASLAFTNNQDALAGTVGSTQNATGSYGNIFSPLIIAASTFSSLVSLFTIFPGLALTVLTTGLGIGSNFPNVTGVPGFSIGFFLAGIIGFVVIISGISWLYGRFLNP